MASVVTTKLSLVDVNRLLEVLEYASERAVEEVREHRERSGDLKGAAREEAILAWRRANYLHHDAHRLVELIKD